MEQAALVIIAVLGVPALTAGYIVLVERLLARFPVRIQGRLRPWAWLGPALGVLAVYLVYPALHTIWLSFLDATSREPVGLANYRFIFSDQAVLAALRNNLIWVLVFPAGSVGLGLLLAVLTDRVRYERVARGVIFLPMAISFVAAGVIWKLMYDFRPAGAPQTGLLNATLVAVVPGFEPRAWLIDPPLNTLALIAAMVWVWTGFCMVILAAALKAIPVEIVEAARVDGASDLQVFRHVILPMLMPTIAVVATTMVMFSLKAFDIVYVMTNGHFETEVIANRMYKELFNVRDFGRASAIAVVLILAVLPLILLNLRQLRQHGGMRS